MATIHIKYYCCALLLVWAVSFSRAELVINEVLASNSTGLQDGYGERGDWPAIPGDLYRIETCSNLVEAAWQLLEERTATQPTESLPDPDFGIHSTRFYRILWIRE